MLLLFYTLSVHRCTYTRILCLHELYPGNGFITVSLWRQITREVFLASSNYLLAISAAANSETALDYCCILHCTLSTTTAIVLPNSSYNHFAQSMHRKHMSRYRYLASPSARWLLPSNGLGTDLQKTCHLTATLCCVLAQAARTQRKLLLCCWLCVCCRRCLAMDLHVTVLY
jgi:hypothetical protein